MASLRDILATLRTLKEDLRDLYGVREIAVFGSRARDTAAVVSDLELLVDFDSAETPTLFSLAKLDALLEDALELRLDTVPRDSLNPRYREHIERDLARV